MHNNKILIATILAITLLGCGSSPISEPSYTVGKIEPETLLDKHGQFLDNFRSTHVTPYEQQLIKRWPKDVIFNVYFGTWCHDSEREVPKLLKLLSYNGELKINLIGLDYRKSEPNGRARANKVQFTPTIILTRDGVELGRIVEQPSHSLVEDISQIIKKHSV